MHRIKVERSPIFYIQLQTGQNILKLARRIRVFLIFFRTLLGYLKDCNVAAHSVDSDIFYVVINLSAGSRSYIITLVSNCGV